MQQGRGGMGSKKHGISGHSGPSPRAKLMMAFEANRVAAAERDRKRRDYPVYSTVAEALKARRS